MGVIQWVFGNSGNGELKWKTETENWNGQNENCLLSNTYLSKKTTCKTRPIELATVNYTVHASISQKLVATTAVFFNILFDNRLSDVNNGTL